jgi:hypothetical protein
VFAHVVGVDVESRRTVLLWMIGGVLLGIAGLLVTYYLLTNEFDLFRVTTEGHDFTGLACGTPLDHPDWETGHPCHGAMNRQFSAALVFGLASLAVGIGSVVVGFRRPTSSGTADDSE